MSDQNRLMDQEESGNSDPDNSQRGIYLYGIGLSEGLDVESLESESEDLFAIQTDGLAAIVREVDLNQFSEESLKKKASDRQWLIEQAQKHHAVIAALHERSTVMPATFGSVYESVDTISAALAVQASDLRGQLAEIQDTDEWAVHVFFVAEGAVDRVLERDPDLKRLVQQLEDASEGRSYMLRRQVQARTQAALEQYQDELVAGVFQALGPRTVIIQPEEIKSSRQDSERGEQISRASLLVNRAEREAFLGEAERIHCEYEHIDLEITGPWPPYSFASLPEKRD
jgi:hypothetical protein